MVELLVFCEYNHNHVALTKIPLTMLLNMFAVLVFYIECDNLIYIKCSSLFNVCIS